VAIKSFKCENCGKRFNRFRYAAHLRWCGKPKRADQAQACPVCGKSCRSSQGLGGHMRMHRRSGRRTDPIRTLVEQRDTLRERGMNLLVAAKKLDTVIEAVRRAGP